MKEIINKLDFIKIKKKKICARKGNFKKMRIQATDWEKIFAKEISDKRLYFKLFKELKIQQ